MCEIELNIFVQEVIGEQSVLFKAVIVAKNILIQAQIVEVIFKIMRLF